MTPGQLQETEWSRRALSVWALWAVAFGVAEFLGLRASKDGWLPLTRVVVRYIPRRVVMAGLAWTAAHFWKAYR